MQRGSHERASAAIGLYKSGAMQIWHDEWDIDSAPVSAMLQKLPASGADYSSLSDSVLEAKVSSRITDCRAVLCASFVAGVDTSKFSQLQPPDL